MKISMPLPLWRDAVTWASAACVKTPKPVPVISNALHLIVSGQPHHYDADWQPRPVSTGVTVMATDKYRMCWSHVARPDELSVDLADPTTVALHLPSVTQAMRAWPRLAVEAAYEVHVDIEDTTAWLALRHSDSAVLAAGTIPLYNGPQLNLTPAWFEKTLVPAKRPGQFALDPRLLAPLMAASSKMSGPAVPVRFRGAEKSVLLARHTPGDAPLLSSAMQMAVKL